MSQKRKQLLKSIAQLERKIKQAKTAENRHQRYFTQLIDHNEYLVLALLVPAFLSGWQSGKIARNGWKLKHFANYSFVALFDLFRNYRKISTLIRG